MPEVSFISGNNFSDERGQISFVNDFSFPGVKRFYTITHPDATVIRAWQGHKIEHKYFFVTAGSFVIAWVKIDDWQNPSKDLEVNYKILTADQPGILSIPAGYANGIKALETNSTLLSFSDQDIQEGISDSWRFEKSLWLDWSKF